MKTRPESVDLASRSFPAHPSVLHEVRRFLRERASDARLPDEAQGDVILAASEACANAVLHSGGEMFRVTWRRDHDRVEIQVVDQGVFRRRVPMPEFEGAHGHGIPLMMALVDEVAIREGTDRHPGTVVRLVKYREP